MNDDSIQEENSSNQADEESQTTLPPEVEAGDALIWATLGRDLDARGSGDAKPLLAKQLMARHDQTIPMAGLKVVGFTMLSRYSSYSATSDPTTGEQTSMVWEKLASNPGTEMSVDDGVKLASATLLPPPDARLETSEYDTAGEDPFMIVRWSHHHGGVKVEKDFLQALINGQRGQIFAWHRCWHEVSPTSRLI